MLWTGSGFGSLEYSKVYAAAEEDELARRSRPAAVTTELRVIDECKEDLQFRRQHSVHLQDLSCMLDTHFGSIEQLVRFADGANGSDGEVLSLERNPH